MGRRRTDARSEEGRRLHQNLFDRKGRLKSSARFVLADEDNFESVVTERVYVPADERRRTQEQEEFEQATADLVMVLLASGVAKARPHVERWWRETVRPSVHAQRARLRERRSRRRSTKDNGAAAGSTLNATVELFDAAKEDRPKMSRAEAQARYLAAMAAKAYGEEPLRLVAGADVVEGDSPAKLRRSLAELPAEEVACQRANWCWLDDFQEAPFKSQQSFKGWPGARAVSLCRRMVGRRLTSVSWTRWPA